MNYTFWLAFGSMEAPLRTKLLFWILLGSLSVVFAEIAAGSSPFPFFDLWGLLVVFPLYSLHILVLSYVVFRMGKPTLRNLFLAGAVFGLYEAYITKVLWTGWSGSGLSFFGVQVVETAVLVFFWHPFMAFILPVVVAGRLTSGGGAILPPVARRILDSGAFWAAAAVLLGLEHALNSSLAASILSPLSGFIVLAVLISLWKMSGGSGYRMADLLPDKKWFIALLCMLALLYLAGGILIRSDAIPGLASQAAIWTMYAVFLGLLVANLDKGTGAESGVSGISLWKGLALTAAFGASSVIGGLFPPLPFIAVAVAWPVGCICGILIFLGSLPSALRGDKG